MAGGLLHFKAGQRLYHCIPRARDEMPTRLASPSGSDRGRLRIMVPAWILAGLAMGSHLAISARGALAFEPQPLRSRYGKAACIFGLGLLSPASLALFISHPDWALMYLAHPDHLPTGLGLLLAGLAPGLAVIVGFFVTARLGDEPKLRRIWIGSAILAAIVVIGLGYKRLGDVSYYDAFHHGIDGVSLLGSSLLLPLGLILATTAGVYAYVWMTIRRHVSGGVGPA